MNHGDRTTLLPLQTQNGKQQRRGLPSEVIMLFWFVPTSLSAFHTLHLHKSNQEEFHSLAESIFQVTSKKLPQCQNKQYILMISITTEIWIELAFLVIIFLFLPFPDPSLRPAN